MLCDRLLPSPLYASGSSCMGVSPALTRDFQMPDSWGTGIQPLLCPPPPHSSPGREAPAWPGSCTASPCGVCVSESCLGLLGSLEVQTGSDRALGKGWWGLLAGVLLWPLTCEPPATLGPPSLSVPTGLSVTFSVGLVTQPCNLTETRFFFFSLSWTLVPSSSPFELLGGSTVRLLSPSQSQGAEYRAVSTPRGCPSAPAHWPLCLTLKPWQPSSAISPLLHNPQWLPIASQRNASIAFKALH